MSADKMYALFTNLWRKKNKVEMSKLTERAQMLLHNNNVHSILCSGRSVQVRGIFDIIISWCRWLLRR